MLTHRLMIVMRLYGILKRNVINRFVQSFEFFFVVVRRLGVCCVQLVDWLNSTLKLHFIRLNHARDNVDFFVLVLALFRFEAGFHSQFFFLVKCI